MFSKKAFSVLHHQRRPFFNERTRPCRAGNSFERLSIAWVVVAGLVTRTASIHDEGRTLCQEEQETATMIQLQWLSKVDPLALECQDSYVNAIAAALLNSDADVRFLALRATSNAAGSNEFRAELIDAGALDACLRMAQSDTCCDIHFTRHLAHAVAVLSTPIHGRTRINSNIKFTATLKEDDVPIVPTDVWSQTPYPPPMVWTSHAEENGWTATLVAWCSHSDPCVRASAIATLSTILDSGEDVSVWLSFP